MNTRNEILDGLSELDGEMPQIVKMISRTALWVHPEVFRTLPVWRPETARTQKLYLKDWSTPAKTNGKRRVETNVAAQKSLLSALDVKSKLSNWTTCHIWGYDDPTYAKKSHIVQDRRFYSCVGNMVLIPTPLKGFTDVVPDIQHYLRVCAFHLYGWVCQHEDVADEAELICSGKIPNGYPKEWPTRERQILPPKTGPFNDTIKKKIAAQKRKISQRLHSNEFPCYPREAVREVLKFWNIDLEA